MRNPRLFLVMVAALVPVGLLSAEEYAVRQLDIRVDFIEVTADVATKLSLEKEAPKTSGEGQTLRERLLESGDGKMYGSTSVITKSGQRATAQSVSEVIYATEFDPPGEKKEGEEEKNRDPSGRDIPTPTAFEMRPVGVTVEVDPVLGADGHTIDLNLAPEIVELTGEDVVQEIPLGTRTFTTMRMPRFYVMKVQTAVTIEAGGTQWIGTLIPRDDEGKMDAERRILVLVTARVVGA